MLVPVALELRHCLRILLPLIVRFSFSKPLPPSTPPLQNKLYDGPRFIFFPVHRTVCLDSFFSFLFLQQIQT